MAISLDADQRTLIDPALSAPMMPRARWKGLGKELTVQQKLACALRIIAGAGANLDLTGHITVVVDDAGNMLGSPWGMWWEEACASDICLVSPAGELISGR